jgi:methyl-galactoside transport system substrate-binding protein
MKKILSVLLASVMLLGLCSVAAADGPIQVDVFYCDYSDTYLGSVRTAMQEKLDAAGDLFTYNFYDGALNQATQTQQVETALTRGTDLLIMNIVTTGSEEAAQNIVDMAAEKGVPVIFFNREISDAVVNSYDQCAFVGTDADEAGSMEGQAIADFLLLEGNLDKYDLNGDKEIAYLMFRGELGNAEAFGRTKYSVYQANLLLEPYGYKLVPSAGNQKDDTQPDDGISPYYLYGNWSAANARNLMDTALTIYGLDNGDIELIIANNDDQALGAIESMNEKGYNTGEEGAGYIPVFGVDATVVAQDAISNGKMTGTVKQDAVGMADYILFLAANIQAGKALMDVPEYYNVDENVDKVRVPYAIFTGVE